MLIPGCSYSYKEHSGQCKTPEQTHRAMEECGCRRCQNALGEPELGTPMREVPKTAESKTIELPGHITWRGRILDRIPPRDSMDSLARYHHGHWCAWTEHLPDQKIAHKWFACWSQAASAGIDSSLGFTQEHSDPVRALDVCLDRTRRDLRKHLSTISELASRMNVLSAVSVSVMSDLDALEAK